MNNGISFKRIDTFGENTLYFGMTSHYKNIINGIIGYRYFDNAVYNNIPKMYLIQLICGSNYQFLQPDKNLEDYEVAIEIQATVSLGYLTNKKCVEILRYNDSKKYLYSIINIKLGTLIEQRLIQDNSTADKSFDSWFSDIDSFPEEVFETGSNINFYPILSNYNSQLYRMYCEIVTDG